MSQNYIYILNFESAPKNKHITYFAHPPQQQIGLVGFIVIFAIDRSTVPHPVRKFFFPLQALSLSFLSKVELQLDKFTVNMVRPLAYHYYSTSPIESHIQIPSPKNSHYLHHQNISPSIYDTTNIANPLVNPFDAAFLSFILNPILSFYIFLSMSLIFNIAILS